MKNISLILITLVSSFGLVLQLPRIVNAFDPRIDQLEAMEAAYPVASNLARVLIHDHALVLKMERQGPVSKAGFYFVITTRAGRLGDHNREQVMVTAYQNFADAFNGRKQNSLQEINLLGEYNL